MSKELTPTETLIWNVLQDGEHHTRDELKQACGIDDLDCDTLLRAHVSKMRKKLNPQALDIVCENRSGIRYRLVRLISSPYDAHR